MLRSLIHLELNFVQGDKYRFARILPHTAIRLEQHQMLNMLSFSSVHLWLFNKKNPAVHRYMNLGLGLQLDFANQCVNFYANTMPSFKKIL